jgi:hypothetical protein
MTLHCPRCGSTSVTPDIGGYGGMIYRCKTCGFRGAFFIESEDQSKIGSWAVPTPVHSTLMKERTQRKSVLMRVLVAVLLFLLLASLITFFGYFL